MSGFDEFDKKNRKSRFRELLELVLLFLVMLLVFNYLLMSVKVNGSSMNPSYVNGDRGIMIRKNPLNKPKHGSIVVVDYHTEAGVKERIVKRVFALPNETFEIKNNEVYVNNDRVEDRNRAEDTKMDDFPKVTLADDEVFILGDNRNISLDSRYIGPIKTKNIEATNGIVYWPISSFSLMD